MGCNCTANLRADIIKRFFANDARRHEFALELIRIVECQQTVMSLDLQEWFRIYFGFSDILFEEFLACVMKRQTTMSAELQKVIRARYFPTSQQMALDFIRVVLCACCPGLCGSDLFIIGISNNYTVDGWYLQTDASNLVYMESGVITETVACESGIASYGHDSGGGYEAPHVFLDGIWNPIIYTELKDMGGTSRELNVTVDGRYEDGSSILTESSVDGGATWQLIGTSTVFNNPTVFPFDLGTSNFIYRTTLTLANGCQFFNPSSPESNVAVTYFILDDQFLNQFIGWTFDGTDLLDWRNNVLPTLPNFLFDASVVESGDSLYVSFFGVGHPNIVVVDSLSNPVTLNWNTITTTVPCLTTTFTVVDPTDTIIQYLMIGNYVLPSSSLPVTDPQCAVEIQNIFIGNGFGTTTTVNISVVGNDVTLTVHGSNGLITGIRWSDSLFNTGDETFTNC